MLVRIPLKKNVDHSIFVSYALGRKKQLFKMPDFGVFFRRLLFRVDQLGQQFSGMARRKPEEVQMLNRLAEQVRLVNADVSWHEL